MVGEREEEEGEERWGGKEEDLVAKNVGIVWRNVALGSYRTTYTIKWPVSGETIFNCLWAFKTRFARYT